MVKYGRKLRATEGQYHADRMETDGNGWKRLETKGDRRDTGGRQERDRRETGGRQEGDRRETGDNDEIMARWWRDTGDNGEILAR